MDFRIRPGISAGTHSLMQDGKTRGIEDGQFIGVLADAKHLHQPVQFLAQGVKRSDFRAPVGDVLAPEKFKGFGPAGCTTSVFLALAECNSRQERVEPNGSQAACTNPVQPSFGRTKQNTTSQRQEMGDSSW